MEFIKLVIDIDDDYQETLIAELDELDFEGFEQLDNRLIAYIPQARFNDVSRERIEQLLAAFPGDGIVHSEELVADRNWNEAWEATIQAQQIGRFFVKPTWSNETAQEGAIELLIDPKMAFGTGYHETTRLMLRALPDVIADDDRVLDAGTGTGILAIAAVKLGAAKAFGFDTDEWSYLNARENTLLNDTGDAVTLMEGSIETVPGQAEYDAVLANINRNVIVELLPALAGHLKTGGYLLLSGLLEGDREFIERQAALQAMEQLLVTQENEWICLLYRKS